MSWLALSGSAETTLLRGLRLTLAASDGPQTGDFRAPTEVLKRRFSLHLLLLCSGLLILGLLCLSLGFNTRPLHNELSIYSGYPEYVWVLLYALFANGILLAVNDSVFHTRSVVPGLSFAFLSNSVFLLVPYFQGYYMADPGDPTAMFGLVMDIKLTGHILSQDFYPSFHILFFSVATITNLSYNTVSFMSLPLLYLFFLIGVCLLCRALALTQRATSAALILMSALIYPEIGVAVPRTFLTALFPLFMSVLIFTVKRKSRGYLLLMAIFILALVLGHPVNGGPLLFAPTMLVLILMPRNKSSSGPKSILGEPRRQVYLKVVAVWSFIWLGWIADFTQLQAGLRELANIIYGESYLTYATNAISNSQLPGYFIVEILLKNWGAEFFYVALGLGLSVLSLLSLLRRRTVQPSILFLCLLFLTFGAWLVGSVFVGTGLEWYRFIPYVLIPSCILTGVRLSKSSRMVTVSLVLVLVLSSQAVGFLSQYPSAWTSSVNGSVTNADMDAYSFFVSSEVTSIPVLQMWVQPFGPLVALKSNNFQYANIGSDSIPPVGLNYTGEETGVPPGSSFYLFVPWDAGNYYQASFPQFPFMWKYNSTDLVLLEKQPVTAIIYSNPTLNIFILTKS